MGVAGILALSEGGQTVDGKDRAVAKIIEFYIPTGIPKRVKWIPPQQRGKVIEFSLPPKRTA
jgi:hypothetical protein